MPNYQKRAIELVVDDYNKARRNVRHILPRDVYVVWFTKTLGNWKAMVATNVEGDGVYYEVTHNGAKHETYLDRYEKVSNEAVPDETHFEVEARHDDRDTYEAILFTGENAEAVREFVAKSTAAIIVPWPGDYVLRNTDTSETFVLDEDAMWKYYVRKEDSLCPVPAEVGSLETLITKVTVIETGANAEAMYYTGKNLREIQTFLAEAKPETPTALNTGDRNTWFVRDDEWCQQVSEAEFRQLFTLR